MSATSLSKRSLLQIPAGHWLLPVLAFACILLATVTLAQHLQQQDRQESLSSFSLDAALVTVEIRDRLRSHGQFLQSLRAFVASSAQLEPADWQRFSNYQDTKTNLPGIQAYGYLPAVPPQQLNSFEANTRKLLNLPLYKVFPSGGLQPHFPVLYVSPAEGGNLNGLGFDLASDPTRREAMERSRDTNMVAMTARVQLIPDQRESTRPGFILFLPIYDLKLPVSSVSERQEAIRGYVFAAYRMSDFIQTLNYSRNPSLALQIFDDGGYDSLKGGQQLALLHDTLPERETARAATLSEERELSFGSRTWLLRFEDARPPSLLVLRSPASIILISGLILASLTGVLIWFLTTQGRRALLLAQGKTSQLELSEQRFRLAAEGANDGLWHRDFQNNTFYFSDRAMKLLGYPNQVPELHEDFFLSLLHPDDAALRRQALEAHLNAHQPFDLELRLKRGDGSWGWFHLKGQATWDEQGKPLLMAGSLSDINDRKQGEIELRQHRDRLQELVEQRTVRLEGALKDAREAARAKSEFLANMSHELRTPLHAMLGFAGIGKGKTEDNEKIHRYFERIQQSAERLLFLVNDLLDLAKLEAQKMEVRPTLQDIQPVLQQVVGELDPLLQKKHLQLEYHSHCPDTRALVDAPRLAQVLNNLLSNAIRFSPEGGSIIFTFVPAQVPRGRRASDQGQLEAIALMVEDQGPGIPADELDLIFDKFAQSTRTRTGAGGTGLGLAICLEIMAAHRGQIRAENRQQGGARLIVTLPREIDATPHEENHL